MSEATAARKPRIALISSSYFPHFGGVEEHVRQVARQLTRLGVAVEVWTVDRGQQLGEQKVDGLRVRYLPTPLPSRSAGGLTRFLLRAPAAWIRWRRAYTQFKPDLLHVHCFGPNGVYALRLHDRTGAPLAVTGHGETLADDNGAYRRSQLLRTSLSKALTKAVFVTAPSEYVLGDLRESYGLRTGVVVPNGVDLDVRPDPAAPRLDDDPYLLGVGRLGKMKGFDLLIEAYARSGVHDTYRLLIGGDGPERSALTALAADRGVGDRVRFLGRLQPQAVADAMAQARALVVPSRIEAFGIVALEAWRSSTALIMTDRGGAPEFVHDGIDGLLVDPEDTAALARALDTIVNDGALRDRLASAGRTHVDAFTWARVAEQYRNLYTTAVSVSAR
ncbi:glycosyltransferase family 4 protein [Rathayibacter soli]|uniref:glycosyltransferase family 4 protein n=1 Tax=Rathayibacter soli TaxID=3144168 RepID=UPI0027E5B314|nr:glycosyltransferase family 4 protein [Glaciibacter superstes]